MPYVTEYNTSLVLKKIIKEIPDDILQWKPYRKDIYFLNRLDKAGLHYFKKFCENPLQNIEEIYNPIEFVDSKDFVFEGGRPSYHKYKSCPNLHSDFVNYRLPIQIKEQEDDKIKEYRKWFKENQELFLRKPDIFEMRLQSKYGIETKIQRVDYMNSGTIYMENLSLKEIETRIDSLLTNAAVYYKEDKERQAAIRRFQKATFLGFKNTEIKENKTSYSDKALKEILREYSILFVQPTIFYLKEYFRIRYNANIEINEKILEQLNFKKCNTCYAEDFKIKEAYTDENNKYLKERFGDYEYTVEPSKFLFKDLQGTNSRIAFFYSRVFKRIDSDFIEDDNGQYKRFKVEFINHNNKYAYEETKIYSNEIDSIVLYKKYLTKVIQNKENNQAALVTYSVEL